MAKLSWAMVPLIFTLAACGSDNEGGQPVPRAQASQTIVGSVTKEFPLADRRKAVGGDPGAANGARCMTGVTKPPIPGSQVICEG